MDEKTKEIQDWWDKNPFTLGVATGAYKNRDLVGRVDSEKMDLKFFQEIERRFRKHIGTGSQDLNKPLLSKFMSEDLNGKDVLDIATGSGLFAVSFAERGANVTAIDLTKYAVLETKTNFELRNLKGNIMQMDAQRMTFQDKSFDFVNAWGCLMHMPDTEGAIKEIYRVLRPSGSALAYMYNKSSWPFWFNTILVKGILMGDLIKYKFDITKLTSRYSDGASVGGNMLTKFYRPKDVRVMFKNAGFNKVDVLPLQIDHEPNHWPIRQVPVFKYLPQNVKSWMAKRWGYGLVVRASK